MLGPADDFPCASSVLGKQKTLEIEFSCNKLANLRQDRLFGHGNCRTDGVAWAKDVFVDTVI